MDKKHYYYYLLSFFFFLESIGSIVEALNKINSGGEVSANPTSRATSATTSEFVSGGENLKLCLL